MEVWEFEVFILICQRMVSSSENNLSERFIKKCGLEISNLDFASFGDLWNGRIGFELYLSIFIVTYVTKFVNQFIFHPKFILKEDFAKLAFDLILNTKL